MRPISILRLTVIIAIGIGLSVLAYYSPAFFRKAEPESPDVQLKMGGSSVVYFIMDPWQREYKKQGVHLDYKSTGSANGVSKMIDKDYQIGFTSNPLTEEQLKDAQTKGGEVVHIPVVLIAVVPIYNVKELKDKPPLKFNAEVLAKIFLGKIDKWNHSDLKELNPDVKLPGAKITVVHRKDKSGTTFVFSDYLYGASETWKKEIGPPSEEVKWPVGEAVERNHGIAGKVFRTEGSIGYVESHHAVTNSIPYGAVENKDKTGFILATAETVTAAAKGLTSAIPAEMKLTNRPGKNAYPICAIDWAVCYQTQPASHQKIIVDFLHWATHDGQKYSKDLQYAPLSDELVQRAEQQLKTIKTVQ